MPPSSVGGTCTLRTCPFARTTEQEANDLHHNTSWTKQKRKQMNSFPLVPEKHQSGTPTQLHSNGRTRFYRRRKNNEQTKKNNETKSQWHSLAFATSGFWYWNRIVFFSGAVIELLLCTCTVEFYGPHRRDAGAAIKEPVLVPGGHQFAFHLEPIRQCGNRPSMKCPLAVILIALCCSSRTAAALLPLEVRNTHTK